MNKDNEPRQSTAPIWCYALPGLFSFVKMRKIVAVGGVGVV